MSEPLSVIVPVRDTDPAFLEHAVESVLAQDPGRLTPHVCIVDDHSTSVETREALDLLAGRERVQVVQNTRRPGIAAARNSGLERTEGEWISFLDSDDQWMPKALEAFEKVLAGAPSPRFLSGDTVIWREETEYLWNTGNERAGSFSEALLAARADDTWLTLDPAVGEILRYSIIPTTGAVLMHRSAPETVGGFDEALERGEDVHLMLRMAKRFPLHFLPKPVLQYRQHPKSVTWGTPPGVGHQAFLPPLLNDEAWEEWHQEIRYRLATSHDSSSWWYRERGDWNQAIHHSLYAIRYQPYHLPNWKHLLGTILRRR